jgi:O-acetylserine/cysteine efflux transporter
MRLDGMTVAAWISLFTAPQLFLASLLFEEGQVDAITSAGPRVWLVVIYLGLIMTTLGDTLWNTLVRRHPISTIAPFLLMQPIFSAIGAVVFLGEVLTLPILVGGAIIASGVAFILRK